MFKRKLLALVLPLIDKWKASEFDGLEESLRKSKEQAESDKAYIKVLEGRLTVLGFAADCGTPLIKESKYWSSDLQRVIDLYKRKEEMERKVERLQDELRDAKAERRVEA